jgi:hypothetical protein
MERMDKKTGFKECSRCGLRNKPTAKQCDFCGQRFEVNDDWEQQIDALEKMSRNSRKEEVSEDLTRKIEATIVTKEMVDTKERAVPEPPKPAEPIEAAFPEPERHAAKPAPIAPIPVKAEPIAIRHPEPAPRPVEERPIVREPEIMEPEPVHIEPEPVYSLEEAPAPEMGGPEKADVRVRKREKKRAKPQPSARFFRWGVSTKDPISIVFAGLMFLGIVSYIVAMVISSSLGTMVSWGFTVVSGALIVMGFSQVAINWEVADEPVRVDIPGTADDEIVEICPSCHERVNPDLDRCPACGIEFEPSEDQ